MLLLFVFDFVGKLECMMGVAYFVNYYNSACSKFIFVIFILNILIAAFGIILPIVGFEKTDTFMASVEDS